MVDHGVPAGVVEQDGGPPVQFMKAIISLEKHIEKTHVAIQSIRLEWAKLEKTKLEESRYSPIRFLLAGAKHNNM